MFIVLKNTQGFRREGYKSGILPAMLNEGKKHLFGTGGGWQDEQIPRKVGGFKWVCNLGLLLNSLGVVCCGLPVHETFQELQQMTFCCISYWT